MFKSKLLMLRRYDPDTEKYYTYYFTDDKVGCFHQISKENFNDTTTTIKVTKDKLYEIRVCGDLNWRSVGFGEFRLRLASFNAKRAERGWQPINIVS